MSVTQSSQHLYYTNTRFGFFFYIKCPHPFNRSDHSKNIVNTNHFKNPLLQSHWTSVNQIALSFMGIWLTTGDNHLTGVIPLSCVRMVVLVFVTELSCICYGIVLYLLRNCLVYVTELSCICYGIVLYLLRNCLVYVTELSCICYGIVLWSVFGK